MTHLMRPLYVFPSNFEVMVYIVRGYLTSDLVYIFILYKQFSVSRSTQITNERCFSYVSSKSFLK